MEEKDKGTKIRCSNENGLFAEFPTASQDS